MYNTKVNFLQYAVLSLVLVAGLLLLFMYQGKPHIQFYIGIGLVISYFSWGMIHHFLYGDLHKKHMVEYGLLAVLGLVLLKIVLL